MEIKGKLVNKLVPVSGTSAKGQWTKQEINIQTEETYPKQVIVSFWNEAAESVGKLPIGTVLTIQIAIESREYNGRWYTEVKGIKFDTAMVETPPKTPEPLNSIPDTELPF